MNSEFDIYVNTILEYFVENARAYYIDSEGEFHEVSHTHIHQIMDDYELSDEISSEFEGMFGERIDWDNDDEFVVEWMGQWLKDNQVYCIVHDIVNKIDYIRASSNYLNDKQRQNLIEFCINKHSELEYDTTKFA